MASKPAAAVAKYLLPLSDLSLPNSTHFSNVLQTCIHSNSLRAAQQTHARLLKTHFSSETFIQNRLIDTYAKCGSVSYAHNLFDKMSHRNTFTYNAMLSTLTKAGRLEDADRLFRSMPEPDQCSWNSMVSGFAQHGQFDEALELFGAMHREDFVLNVYSFSSALSACAGLVDSRTGMQIHALVSKSGFAYDVFMGSALVDMYSKCRLPSLACKVFEGMPERNVVSWNSLITCYEQNGPTNEALVLFKRLMESELEFDEVTLASVVSACATLSAVRQGSEIHAHSIKFDKFRDDLVLANALVDMYAKCHRIREARAIFDRMPVRSIVTGTSMICGYAKVSSVRDAKLMFSSMTDKNVIAWNALISGYTQNGNDQEAMRLFRMLKRESVWPTHYTFGNILNACANLSDLQLGKQAHGHILKHGFQFEAGPDPDIFVGNSLVDMYLKCGTIDEGGKVFERMVFKDKVSWNAIIVGYAQNGRAEEALQLFRRMLESGETPDHVTMIGVLSGCSHAGLMDDGRHYFQSMTAEYGLIPSQDHYTCMVDMLGRAGRLAEVEAFIKDMPFAPDSVLWSSLLAACRAHGDVRMGEWVAEKLFELDSENSGPYVLLSNMYAETRRWEDVVRIRRLMKQNGVVKQPGCSWIEIERKVHVFLVKDKRHPKRKDIYRTLRCLRMQMKRIGSDISTFFNFDLLCCSCW